MTFEKGDITVLVIYILCALCGAVIFIFGFGYNSADRNIFGLITIISIVLMILYYTLCNIEVTKINDVQQS